MDPKLAKYIGDRMTCRLGKKDFPDLRFYARSPKRIVVTLYDTLMPEAVLGPAAEQTLGLTLRQIQDQILEAGGKQVKRPKPYRSAPPLYD